MIICPNCNKHNDSVSIMEMKSWKQRTVDFSCNHCDYSCNLKPSEYAPMMERDKNGC